MASRPKKSPSLKEPPKVEPAARKAQSAAAVPADDLAHLPPCIAARIRRIRACKPINEQTILEPLWVAESIVDECSRWLGERLPEEWPAALAAKAEKCFAANEYFRRAIKSPAHDRANLRMYMRHWLAGLLQRHRRTLYQRLPYEYRLGKPALYPPRPPQPPGPSTPKRRRSTPTA